MSLKLDEFYTHQVSRQERHACAHDETALCPTALTTASVRAHDRMLSARQKGSIATEDGGFHVATWFTMSRHGPSVAMGSCVVTGFPSKPEGLDRNKNLSVTTESCWPRVAT